MHVYTLLNVMLYSKGLFYESTGPKVTIYCI